MNRRISKQCRLFQQVSCNILLSHKSVGKTALLIPLMHLAAACWQLTTVALTIVSYAKNITNMPANNIHLKPWRRWYWTAGADTYKRHSNTMKSVVPFTRQVRKTKHTRNLRHSLKPDTTQKPHFSYSCCWLTGTERSVLKGVRDPKTLLWQHGGCSCCLLTTNDTPRQKRECYKYVQPTFSSMRACCARFFAIMDGGTVARRETGWGKGACLQWTHSSSQEALFETDPPRDHRFWPGEDEFTLG